MHLELVLSDADASNWNYGEYELTMMLKTNDSGVIKANEPDEVIGAGFLKRSFNRAVSALYNGKILEEKENEAFISLSTTNPEADMIHLMYKDMPPDKVQASALFVRLKAMEPMAAATGPKTLASPTGGSIGVLDEDIKKGSNGAVGQFLIHNFSYTIKSNLSVHYKG